MLVLFLFNWGIILSEDCDFWWFQLEKEIAKDEDGTANMKYVISVDFGTTSKVHLNPLYFIS